MTAIKQANSSHLSSLSLSFLVWNSPAEGEPAQQQTERERERGRLLWSPVPLPRDIRDAESALQHVTRERTHRRIIFYSLMRPANVRSTFIYEKKY